MVYNSWRPHRVPLLSTETTIHTSSPKYNRRLKKSYLVCWFMLWHLNGRVRIWHKQHESMDPSCLVSMVQAATGGVMVWGIFSWHTLGPLIPTKHCLNTTAYVYCFCPCSSLYDHSVTTTSSRIMSLSSNHLRLVSWTWQWVHFT